MDTSLEEGKLPAAARMADGKRRQGARVMASFRMMAPAPPEAELCKYTRTGKDNQKMNEQRIKSGL